MTGRPRFIADCMLGKLARWLRILGYDASYQNDIGDAELVERARAEGRILLTRDTRLILRKEMPPHLLVASQDPPEQVRQVLEAFGLEPDPEAFLSRCLPCNRETERIGKEEARPEVPPYVYETQDRFARCPACRRIYWRATHVDEMVKAVGELGPEGGEPPYST